MELKITSNDKAGIDGHHILSLCDTRYPQVKKIEQEIVKFMDEDDEKIKLLRLSFYDAKKRSVLDTLDTTYKDIQSIINRMKEDRFQTLAAMYKEMQRIGLVNQIEVHNIIPTAGRSVIARWIIGDDTYAADTAVNYGSLGTSNTAVNNADTQLTAESYRKATSSVSRSNNIAYLSNFYTATEVTGTFEEAGWHIVGTGAANTGQLLSHFLTTTTNKSTVETLTCQSTLTIS